MRTLLDNSGMDLDVQENVSPAYVRQDHKNKSINKVNNEKPVSAVSDSNTNKSNTVKNLFAMTKGKQFKKLEPYMAHLLYIWRV